MANSIGSYTIRTTPEDLQRCAADLYRELGRVKSIFENIDSRIKSTKNYWEGEASETYRGDYEEEKKEIERMFLRLEEHSVDLDQIAAIYTGVEKAIIETEDRFLSGDVIV